MKEIFQAINEYPWTTFFCWLMILSMIGVYKNYDKE
jgi:hypothetical protein